MSEVNNIKGIHEKCERIFVRRGLTNIICIGYNPEGVKENPEDVIVLCFYSKDALEPDQDNPEVGYLNGDKRLLHWNMTPLEAIDVAISLTEGAKKALTFEVRK